VSYRARWTETSPEPQTETLPVIPFDAEADSDDQASSRFAYEPEPAAGPESAAAHERGPGFAPEAAHAPEAARAPEPGDAHAPEAARAPEPAHTPEPGDTHTPEAARAPGPGPAPQPGPVADERPTSAAPMAGFRDRIARALQSFDPRRPGHPSLEAGPQPADVDEAGPSEAAHDDYEPHEVVAAVSPRVEDSRFPLGPIGYNRAAVDERIAELEVELDELRASTEQPISITEEIERLGEQTASILVVAHDEAHETTRAAREHADRTIADAAAGAAAMTENAKRKLADLDNETDAVWRERARLLDDARDVGLALIALAEEALERFPAEGKTADVAAVAGSSADETDDMAPEAEGSADETGDVGPEAGWSSEETGEMAAPDMAGPQPDA
jgi:cell division septum initiation protein DivIVA